MLDARYEDMNHRWNLINHGWNLINHGWNLLNCWKYEDINHMWNLTNCWKYEGMNSIWNIWLYFHLYFWTISACRCMHFPLPHYLSLFFFFIHSLSHTSNWVCKKKRKEKWYKAGQDIHMDMSKMLFQKCPNQTQLRPRNRYFTVSLQKTQAILDMESKNKADTTEKKKKTDQPTFLMGRNGINIMGTFFFYSLTLKLPSKPYTSP